MRRSLRSFGCVGDGSTDDTANLLTALAAGVPLTGEGRTYAVSGDIDLPDGFDLEDATFKQTSQSTTRKTLKRTSANTRRCSLRRVYVDRNGATTDGQVQTSGGIWLENLTGFELEDVGVKGNGKGSGIYLLNCHHFSVVRPKVHDMRWSAASDPGTEQINGLWCNNCTHFTIIDPKVRNLDGVIGAVTRAYQTDGITISGCYSFGLFGGSIRNCGEGLDVTGSVGNYAFIVVGMVAEEIDSFGFKFANSAYQGSVQACIAKECGYAGFVVSGASEAGLPKSYDLTFSACRAVNPGANGNWSAQETAGFLILQGTFDTDWPQRVKFVDCVAIDSQAVATMKYGFKSNIPVSAGGVINRCVRCKSFGHIVDGIAGTLENTVSVEVTQSATFAVPNNAETKITGGLATGHDVYNMHDGAGTFTIREDGMYEIAAQVEWAANANGFRLLTVYVNGSPLMRTTAIGNGTVGPNLSINFKRRLARGSIVDFRVYQNSGGSLNVNNTVGTQFSIVLIE